MITKMVRLVYKRWGFVIEKQFDSWVPMWYLFFGTYYVSYNYFHSGKGIHIHLPGINILIATQGQIGWWLNPGKGIIDIFKYHKEW